MAEITLHLGARQFMTSNQRLHWRERHKRTAYIREQTGWLARASGIRSITRVKAVAHVSYPKGTGRADPANMYPTVKAMVDGLVDAGLMSDDDHKHLIGPDMRRTEKNNDGRVWSIRLIIEPLED